MSGIGKDAANTDDTLFGTQQMLGKANIPAMTFRSESGGLVTLVPKEFEKDFDIVTAKASVESAIGVGTPCFLN